MQELENPASCSDWPWTSSEETFRRLLVCIIVNASLLVRQQRCILIQGRIKYLFLPTRSWFPNKENASGRREDQPADMGHSWAGEVWTLTGSINRKLPFTMTCIRNVLFEYENTYIHSLFAAGFAVLPGPIFVKLMESCYSTMSPQKAASSMSEHGWIRFR